MLKKTTRRAFSENNAGHEAIISRRIDFEIIELGDFTFGRARNFATRSAPPNIYQTLRFFPSSVDKRNDTKSIDYEPFVFRNFP